MPDSAAARRVGHAKQSLTTWSRLGCSGPTELPLCGTGQDGSAFTVYGTHTPAHAAMTEANSDIRWSITDDTRLLWYIEHGQSIAETARQLNRRPEEVRERLAILGRETQTLFP